MLSWGPGDGQQCAPLLCRNIEYTGSFLQTINLIVNVTNATSWGWRLSLGFAFVPSFFLFLGADLHCQELRHSLQHIVISEVAVHVQVAFSCLTPQTVCSSAASLSR